MAPAKNQKKAMGPQLQANAAWASLRLVDAPPKPISEGVAPETSDLEIFTPIIVQDQRGAPNLSPPLVYLPFDLVKKTQAEVSSV